VVVAAAKRRTELKLGGQFRQPGGSETGKLLPINFIAAARHNARFEVELIGREML
jgi:hypothetical protein